MMVKINLVITLLSNLSNSRLPKVPNSPCDSTRILNVYKVIALVFSKQKTLQLQYVPLALNARVKPAFF